ncbi:uncharacterized protein LOC106672958 isoform X2 [Cimex lectularius]|uniref:Ubinuclein middle domain-containing protein n=1 Tax=Cimex lectularius TaxID=79782 RepID=A0A8I6STM0_CIMLE|nr:uncharacterized protein LOC106672958 isoform X2 [Cimex lectularius]
MRRKKRNMFQGDEDVPKTPPPAPRENRPSGSSFRFNLPLCPDDHNCPIFNFKELCSEASKNCNAGSEDSSKLTCLKDGDLELEKPQSHVKYTMKTYVELASGYDEDDSFIDNSEACNDMIEGVENLNGKFYVNCGALNLNKKDTVVKERTFGGKSVSTKAKKVKPKQEKTEKKKTKEAGECKKKPKLSTDTVPCLINVSQPDILKLIDQLKNYTKEVQSTQKNFFDKNIVQLLVELECQCRKYLKNPSRQSVYSHLSYFMPISKGTLLRKVKTLFVQGNSELDTYMQKLKDIAKSENKLDEISAPEKLLCLKEIAKRVVRQYVVAIKRKGTLHNYIMAFYTEKLVPLWPNGLMDESTLFRYTKDVIASEAAEYKIDYLMSSPSTDIAECKLLDE